MERTGYVFTSYSLLHTAYGSGPCYLFCAGTHTCEKLMGRALLKLRYRSVLGARGASSSLGKWVTRKIK